MRDVKWQPRMHPAEKKVKTRKQLMMRSGAPAKTRDDDPTCYSSTEGDPAQPVHHPWYDSQRHGIPGPASASQESGPSSVFSPTGGSSQFVCGSGDRKLSNIKARRVAIARGTAPAAPIAPAAPPASATLVGPLTMEEISKGTLTEDMLRAVAGTRRLETVTHLELVIDSAETPSVEGVWPSVPSLHTLVLNGSRLMSFRDLGVGLRNLHTLSLEDSGVDDLDGIGVLSGLKELRLANNNVSDVTPLACHGHLQVLDLEQNRIGDVKELEIMGTISLLYSLNLKQNPLMSSLGKLPGGQGRGVVHRLIPQLRVLDGTPLSVLETDIVDVDALLRDTNALAREGAFGARAAWEERNGENMTVPCAGRNGCLAKEEATKTALSPVLSTSPERGRRLKPREGSGGEHVLKASPDRGIVHWDSDLTQGGCPAFSGKPSSAIRRYKVGGDNGARQRQPSPQGVLDTLNLAKQMELGLRHRQNQLEDRVLEWQREISSDSLPQGEQITRPRHPSATVPEYSGSNPRAGAATDTSSMGCTKDSSRHELARGRTKKMRRRRGGTWASALTDGQSVKSEEEGGGRDDGSVVGIRNVPNAGDIPLSSRPWTTGHLVGSSSGLASPLSLSVSPRSGRAMSPSNPAMEVTSDSHNGSSTKHEAGIVNNEKRVKGGDQGTGARKEEYLHDRRTQCRRPQTAVELGRRRHSSHGGTSLVGGEDGSTLNAGWLHVWESLQTAGLHKTNVSKAAGAPLTPSRDHSSSSRSPIPTSSSAVSVPGRVRSTKVDFQRQRRTRRMARTRSAGLRRGDGVGDVVAYIRRGSRSTTEEDGDEQGSASTDENENGRDEIKKRAAAFADDRPWTSSDDRGAGPDCSNNAATTRSMMPCGRPVDVAQSAHRDAQPGTHRRDVRSAASVEEGIILSAKTAHRRTRKGNRGRTTASRRSLATMDDSSSSSSSSSEGGDIRWRKQKRPIKGGDGVGGSSKCDGSNGGSCVIGADVRGENNIMYDRESRGGAATAGRSGAASRRVSSVHAASRMLGFDLRKSLAAINEWTQKATLTAVDGGQPDTCRTANVTPRLLSLGVVSDFDEIVTSPCTPTSCHPWSAEAKGNGPRDRNSHHSHIVKEENSRQANREKRRGGGSPVNACGAKDSPSVEASGRRASGDVFCNAVGSSEDGSEDEEVLSIAAARAALGISRGQGASRCSGTATAPTSTNSCSTGPPKHGRTKGGESVASGGEDKTLTPRYPSASEIDAIMEPAEAAARAGGGEHGDYKGPMESSVEERNKSRGGGGGGSDRSTGDSRRRKSAGRGVSSDAKSSSSNTIEGLAVSMSDDALEKMLRRQPRTVPELRTKDSFRDFFKGMKAERMSRLLRGAYDGTLPPGEVELKVEKRLGLVGDMLAW